MQLLGFKDYQAQGKHLAAALGIDYLEVEVHRFPDGESKVTLPTGLDEQVIFCRSLDHPNNKLIELFLSVNVARQQGVKHITLVAPYLCYMRQDIAFHRGEAVSQKIIGQWLGGLLDKVVTVDPHLHRIKTLGEAIPNTETVTLTATGLMAGFLASRPTQPVLLGPDAESKQWVKQIADETGLDWCVATKHRHSDHKVGIVLPQFDFADRTVVIVDDVTSTGRTIAMAAKQLKNQRAKAINCLVTHPLFVDDAEQALTNACLNHVWSTDSISHSSNAIKLAPLLVTAIAGSEIIGQSTETT